MSLRSHNPVLCVFLWKDASLTTCCWSINTEVMANSSITHTSLSNPRISSSYGLPAAGTPLSTSALSAGAV